MASPVSEDVKVTLASLKANHFDVRFAQTGAEARAIMLETIPATARVGAGSSVTLKQIGILDELVRRGNEVLNPYTAELTQGMKTNPALRQQFVRLSRMTLGTDVFIASSNALTRDGKLVNIDRVGNRVAGMVYGAPVVILAVGRNKIVKDVDEAIDRIKNVIAPAHARFRERGTPCAITGDCTECDSPDRLCNITVILEKKPMRTDLSIILINEDLGLGWDPAWDEERISRIWDNYCQNSLVF